MEGETLNQPFLITTEKKFQLERGLNMKVQEAVK